MICVEPAVTGEAHCLFHCTSKQSENFLKSFVLVYLSKKPVDNSNYGISNTKKSVDKTAVKGGKKRRKTIRRAMPST